jgi:hypothetical protein
VIKNNLGFMIINLENNSYYENILQNIKKIIDNNPYINISVFSSNCNKIMTHNVPILHLSHAKFFKGDLWTFDLTGILVAKNFPNINKKILYVNDIPWIKNRNNPYEEWERIYDKSIDFVTNNQYTYDIYNICWKQPIDIMEEFNYEKVQSILL